MQITLNIYNKQKEIVKTHTAEGYDLMMGTIEDFMDIIDVEAINDTTALAKMVIKGYKQIKPLMQDIFPELTDEEFKGIKLADLITVIANTGAAVIENLNILKQGNSTRA